MISFLVFQDFKAVKSSILKLTTVYMLLEIKILINVLQNLRQHQVHHLTPVIHLPVAQMLDAMLKMVMLFANVCQNIKAIHMKIADQNAWLAQIVQWTRRAFETSVRILVLVPVACLLFVQFQIIYQFVIAQMVQLETPLEFVSLFLEVLRVFPLICFFFEIVDKKF